MLKLLLLSIILNYNHEIIKLIILDVILFIPH
jgi:hypothetical protein